MTDKPKCIQALMPALISTPEQHEMTDKAIKSLNSFTYCIKRTDDFEKNDNGVAGVWNKFLDEWRGKDYDYLLIACNDVVFDPMGIDIAVEVLESNPACGVVSFHVTRDWDDFMENHYGKHEKWSGRYQEGQKDPACLLFKPGVIEKVGRIDEYFPREFVERDYLYRIQLAGYKWLEAEEIIQYHPPYAGTIGNDQDRLQQALRRYVSKWGGDPEKWTHPENNLQLDFTYTVK